MSLSRGQSITFLPHAYYVNVYMPAIWQVAFSYGINTMPKPNVVLMNSFTWSIYRCNPAINYVDVMSTRTFSPDTLCKQHTNLDNYVEQSWDNKIGAWWILRLNYIQRAGSE